MNFISERLNLCTVRSKLKKKIITKLVNVICISILIEHPVYLYT
jgi:hypothetical protein